MVDVKTDFFKMPPPVIRTSSSYQSNAPTYTTSKFKTSYAISDKSKTIDFNMFTGLMRGIPHNTLAFKPSSELIRDVESRRQVSLSPSAKQAIVKYQTEYKTKMNIQPSRNIIVPKNIVDDTVGTIVSDRVKPRKIEILTGSIAGIETQKSLKGIGAKYVKVLKQEFKEEALKEASIAPRKSFKDLGGEFVKDLKQDLTRERSPLINISGNEPKKFFEDLKQGFKVEPQTIISATGIETQKSFEDLSAKYFKALTPSIETQKSFKDLSGKSVKVFEFQKFFKDLKTVPKIKRFPVINIPSVKPFAKAYTAIDPDVSAYFDQIVYQGDKNPLKEAGKEVGVGIGRGVQGAISLPAFFLSDSSTFIKAIPKMVGKIPGMVSSEVKFAKQFPLVAVSEIASGILLDAVVGDPVGKIVAGISDDVAVKITKMSPDYKPPTDNPFGYKEITGVKGVLGDNIDIVLVPGRGQKKPKLNVDSILDSYGNLIPLTKNPKLPKTTNKKLLKILDVIKNTDNIVSGSYSQQALLKKKYTRAFKDLDIGSPDVDKLVDDIVNSLGKDKVRVLQQPTATTIIDIKTGVELADIVPLGVSEGGWAVKYKPINIDGIKLADPRSRLAGKSTALSMNIKLYKTVPDIESLIGTPGALSPLTSGRSGFGFSFVEQAEYAGKVGTIVSGQREIFKKGLLGTELFSGKETIAYKPSLSPLESSLFGSPFDLATGKPLARVTRLATGNADDVGSLWDLISGKADFGKRKQSQILLFENQKIADIPTELKSLFKKAKAGNLTARSEFFKKYRAYQLDDSAIFKPFGFEGSELEVTVFKPTIQKKAKVGTTIIDDTIIPIYSVELKGGATVKTKIKVNKIIDDFIDGSLSEKKLLVIKKDLELRGANKSIISELDALFKKSKLKTNTFTDELRLYNILNKDYSSPSIFKKSYDPARLVKLKTVRKTISESFKTKGSAESYIFNNSKKVSSTIIPSMVASKVGTRPLRQSIAESAKSDLNLIKRATTNTSRSIRGITKGYSLPVIPSSKPIKYVTSKKPIPTKPIDYGITRKAISTKPVKYKFDKSHIDPRPIDYGNDISTPIYSPPRPPSPITGRYTPIRPRPPSIVLTPPPVIPRIRGKSYKKTTKKGAGNVFGVEVRKAGVWKRVDKPNEKHNKNSAIALGIQETGNSSARSFRLVPVAGKANVIRRKPASMLNRYYKKKGRGNPKLANAYIEKPKYAIDSKQELQNITQAGWKTNRANKKKRQAQNSMLSRVLGNNKK